MREVKIREKTENIVSSAPLGIRINEPHNYLQLYFSESGGVVPDNVYTLKQGEREQMCSVIGGQVSGAEWVDRNQVMFLI